MRRPVKKRNVPEADIKYSSLLVSKIINRVMSQGKKSIARKIVYEAMERMEATLKVPAMEALDKAIDNASPAIELRAKRVGGANYQVPVEVRPDRRLALAIRWMIESARSQKGKAMSVKLSEEFINAYNNAGGAVKKKADMQRMAEANRAFAQFSWNS